MWLKYSYWVRLTADHPFIKSSKTPATIFLPDCVHVCDTSKVKMYLCLRLDGT